MTISVKLDEDLSPLVGEPMLRRGCDVTTVLEQGWSGLSDAELWNRVQAEKRLLVTADHGFGDIRAYPPGTHAGIVVLRPERESILNYRDLVEQLMTQRDPESIRGMLTVVTPNRIRIRHSAQ